MGECDCLQDEVSLIKDLKRFIKVNCTKKQSLKLLKGTAICFKPDKTIFTGGIEFEYSLLSAKVKRASVFKWRCKNCFEDERNELTDGSFKKKFTYIKEALKNMFNT